MFRTNPLRTIVRGAALLLAASSVLGSAPALAEPASTPAPAGTLVLTVDVEGVRSGEGMIMAGLMKADPASNRAVQVGGVRVSAVSGTTRLRFEGLAPGDYAVRLFHDEDGNGEMATNLFGLPTEGYGFSNRARAGFGPPSFDEMKVTVAADASTTAIMAY